MGPKELNRQLPLPVVRNWVTNSKHFKDYCNRIFNQVDVDRNNSLSPTEIYCAVLLLYTQIIPWVRTSVPPTKESVIHLCHAYDKNNSGELGHAEFEEIMSVLLSDISKRVVLEGVFLFIGGPMIVALFLILFDAVIVFPEYLTQTYFASMILLTRECITLTIILAVVVPPLIFLFEKLIYKVPNYAFDEVSAKRLSELKRGVSPTPKASIESPATQK